LWQERATGRRGAWRWLDLRGLRCDYKPFQASIAAFTVVQTKFTPMSKAA
jgi:hypothetical protein